MIGFAGNRSTLSAGNEEMLLALGPWTVRIGASVVILPSSREEPHALHIQFTGGGISPDMGLGFPEKRAERCS